MTDVYKAIADPTRRAILDELVQTHDQTLFELCARLVANHAIGSSRQAISQHLTVLEEAGLVHSRQQGRSRMHRVDLAPLRTIVDRWPVPKENP